MPEWQRLFGESAPQVEVRWWDDAGVDPGAVRYVLVWDPEPGRLAGLPNLRVIFGSGAGVDFITSEQIRHLTRCQDIVHVFEKSFVLDFVVSEQERHSFAFLTCDTVEILQIFHKIRHVVRSNHT